MRRLIMTQGLPASGKTTWAKAYAATHNNVEIVCKDDIREALKKTGWTWSPSAEDQVVKLRNSAIKSAFAHGTETVIVADCNFGHHEASLRGIAKGKADAQFEIQDFTHVPLETCIERDAAREKPVGEKVIREMYDRYLAVAQIQTYKGDPNKPIAIICDLDGTLALSDGLRGPYDHAKCADDKLNEPVYEIVRLFAKDMYTILYVSGREEKFRPQTEAFMKRCLVPHGPLIMRATGDKRKDFIVKAELFDDQIRNRYNVLFVLDDRQQVVDMWRKMGLTCLQVAPGNF